MGYHGPEPGVNVRPTTGVLTEPHDRKGKAVAIATALLLSSERGAEHGPVSVA